MEIQPPSDLQPFEVLFDKSELNRALPPDLLRFVGNLGFPPPPAERPWIFANFVQSLDGLASFGGRRHSGEWIARSRHDRWMMDLLRAHADAILYGSRSLVLERPSGSIPGGPRPVPGRSVAPEIAREASRGGPVYRIVHPELLRYRHERLGRKKLIVIIVSGSGNIRPADYRLFHSEHVHGWIATTPEGRALLGDPGETRVLVSGKGNAVDFGDLLRRLRSEHGIEYLLCEGGPMLYGHMVRGGWVDEKFVTVAPQEIGPGIPPEQELTEAEKKSGVTTRPTTFAGTGFTIEEARWYRWVSCRKAGDHEFSRYRAT